MSEDRAIIRLLFSLVRLLVTVDYNTPKTTRVLFASRECDATMVRVQDRTARHLSLVSADQNPAHFVPPYGYCTSRTERSAPPYLLREVRVLPPYSSFRGADGRKGAEKLSRSNLSSSRCHRIASTTTYAPLSELVEYYYWTRPRTGTGLCLLASRIKAGETHLQPRRTGRVEHSPVPIDAAAVAS